MKIGLLIDHLCSGGAQRQLTTLADGLIRRGHTVELIVYWAQPDFFKGHFEAIGVPINLCRKRAGFDTRANMRDLESRNRSNERRYSCYREFMSYVSLVLVTCHTQASVIRLGEKA